MINLKGIKTDAPVVLVSVCCILHPTLLVFHPSGIFCPKHYSAISLPSLMSSCNHSDGPLQMTLKRREGSFKMYHSLYKFHPFNLTFCQKQCSAGAQLSQCLL